MSTDLTDENTHELALILNSAVTRLGRRIRRIDDSQQLGRAQLSALSVLVFGGPRSMTELAGDEMVSAATMHHVVKGLLERDLVERNPDPTDSRRAVISVTPAGQALMESAREDRLHYYRSQLAALGEEDRKAVETFARLALSWVESP